MQFSKRAREAVLHEVVCHHDVAGQGARIAPQARNLRFDVPVRVGHAGFLWLWSTGRTAGRAERHFIETL